MCTYETTVIAIDASGKTASGWQGLSQASVYLDHPVHFPRGHALMIDVSNPALGPSSRVALEMDAPSARGLAQAILATLEAAPCDLVADTVRSDTL